MRCHFLPAGILLLNPCVLGPEPGKPETSAPSSIRGDSSPGGASFGDRAWRKVFTDAAQRALIGRTLQKNPDLIAATYRIEEARAIAATAHASWYPSLDGSAEAGERGKESFGLTALLSWEADLWGGIRRRNQAARSPLLAAEYQHDAVQASLFNAELDLADARRNHLQAIVQAYRALGGGWK